MDFISTFRQVFAPKGTVKPDVYDATENGWKFEERQTTIKDEEAIDFIDENEEITILIRYDNVFRALITRGMYTPLKTELTEKDIGRNVQATVIDSCVHHAIEGNNYLNETVQNLDKTILQSSLIFTVTATMYLNPPVFDSVSLDYGFQILSGFTSFSFLLVIILCTSLTATLNMAYTEVDGLVARLVMNSPIMMTFLLNYIAIIATITNLLIAASQMTKAGVFIQFYGIVIILVAIYQYYKQYSTAAKLQDYRVIKFYKKYCDASGALKKKYAEAVEEAICQRSIP